jgi:hypothetical protein
MERHTKAVFALIKKAIAAGATRSERSGILRQRLDIKHLKSPPRQENSPEFYLPPAEGTFFAFVASLERF